ncbi:MAG: DUF547 domain-containing protein [Betaproteobacteria bacterium]
MLIALALMLTRGNALAQAIDAASYDVLLHSHVENGVVNYAGFQDGVAFKDYVAALAGPAELITHAERVAYNINAYNALAIQGILDGLSPSSLLGRLRYFKLQEWPLDGRAISLYDLEHAVLRPLGEPRIHFAIVCASKSCPFLRSETYTATRLEEQLDAQARAFVNDPSHNRFDKTTRTAHLSEIFKWFDEDFRAGGSVQKYLAQYVSDTDIAKDLAQNGYNVEWIPYNWTLNGTRPRN